jgi:hypothetical protein
MKDRETEEREAKRRKKPNTDLADRRRNRGPLSNVAHEREKARQN